MKRIIAFSILILTVASCGSFKHRQIVFQKEGRKQVIVDNKKQESPKEFTLQKKEVKISNVDIIANINNHIKEEENIQSNNFGIKSNSPFLINESLNTETVKKEKKRDTKKGLKTDKKGIIALILSIVGLILIPLSIEIPFLVILSVGLGISGFTIGIGSIVKNKRDLYKNKNTVWSILSIIFGAILTLVSIALLILYAYMSNFNVHSSYYLT